MLGTLFAGLVATLSPAQEKPNLPKPPVLLMTQIVAIKPEDEALQVVEDNNRRLRLRPRPLKSAEANYEQPASQRRLYARRILD